MTASTEISATGSRRRLVSARRPRLGSSTAAASSAAAAARPLIARVMLAPVE